MDVIQKQNTKLTNALSKEAVKGGIPFPMASFGMPEFDGGERFDLSPYADEGWVDRRIWKRRKRKGGLFGGLFGSERDHQEHERIRGAICTKLTFWKFSPIYI